MNDELLLPLSAASRVIPEIILLATMCLMFFVAPFLVSDRGEAPRGLRDRWGWLSLLALGCAGWAWWSSTPLPLDAGPFRLDPLTWYVRGVMIALGAGLVLLMWDAADDSRSAECQACLLAVIAGVNLVAAANDLSTLFVALELVSIPTYLLLLLPKRDADAQEAALKYFLLSIFSSCLFLFGLTWIFGAVGSTNLVVIQSALWKPTTEWPATVMAGVVLSIAGLAFRLTAVPFHFYAPDVFAGTSLPTAAMLSFIPKVAGLAALLRLIGMPADASPLADGRLMLVLWWIAFLTMCLGNGLALLQTNVRRMLAYSSISHAGYLLVGFFAGNTDARPDGTQAMLFYLATYGIVTLGLFGVLIAASTDGRAMNDVSDLSGLSRTQPALALMAAILLFSLSGLPPSAGFVGKVQLFWAAWSRDSEASRWLAFWLAVNAAVGAGYYLRLVGVIYLSDPVVRTQSTAAPQSSDANASRWPAAAAAVLCSIAALALFFVPAVIASALAAL